MDQLGIDIKIEVSLTYSHRRTILIQQDPTLPAQISEKQTLLNSLPSTDDELYSTWRRLEAHKEFLELQEVGRAAGRCR